MRAAIAAFALLLCACPRGRAPAPQPKEAPVSGAVSPAGDRHPGAILQEDRVAGRTWTDKAEDVPQSIAWVQAGGKWVPVVRIVVTGAGDRREITRYGPKGETLARTVMTRPPGG
ncbi:MAG: hypothetical protein KGL53_07085 [Elusimicrobia bacterium]|nr:hypothetical protein [Elusimicrobiota bacterium]